MEQRQTNDEDQRNAVDLDELQRNVQEEKTRINGGGLHRGAGDPGVSAEMNGKHRLRGMVEEISSGSRRVLTEARDTIDDLMRATDARALSVMDDIEKLAAMADGSVKMAGIIMPKISAHAKLVGEGLNPAPGKTITQR